VTYETLLWEPHPTEKFVTITLNRPEKLNIMSQKLRTELGDAIGRAEADPEIRAVILRGAGRAFSAGYDMSPEAPDRPPGAPTLQQWRARMRNAVDGLMRIRNAQVPVIAAVHGYALAGGLELMMACDVAICAEDARLGEPEIRHVSAPPSLFMPWTIPIQLAKYMMYTGDMISGKEAERMHLVLKAVPADQLMLLAERIATKFARMPYPAIAFNKAAINHAQDTAGIGSSFQFNIETTSSVHSTEEGVWWMEHLRDVGMKEFLRNREGPFKGIPEPAWADIEEGT